MQRTMEAPEPTDLEQLRQLEQDDRRQPALPPPPEGFDSWAEFYAWERSTDSPA